MVTQNCIRLPLTIAEFKKAPYNLRVLTLSKRTVLNKLEKLSM